MNRWQQIKPKTQTLDKDSAINIYTRLKDWQVNWNQLENKVKNCIIDCEHFGMDVPNLSGYQRMRKHMET